MDLRAMRSTAREAVSVGAEVVREGRRPATGEAKGLPGDWVTDVDLASERAIAAFLQGATPGIPVTGEELGGVADGTRWLVDPLDGTTNFVHGFLAVGVSVALVDGERVLAGAIAAPLLGDVWHAARGEGATWEPPDGTPRPCEVSRRPVAEAVVATGFPFRRKERLPHYLPAFTEALITFEDLRRPGAACLDLAWTACGVFDGFFEVGLAPWDVAAGGLLVEEAGGRCSDWDGGAPYVRGHILAGPPAVHDALLAIAAGAGGNPPG
ncbi:MAG TPA: inositol monophosphatase family protein [Actinomycetota bacterium]